MWDSPGLVRHGTGSSSDRVAAAVLLAGISLTVDGVSRTEDSGRITNIDVGVIDFSRPCHGGEPDQTGAVGLSHARNQRDAGAHDLGVAENSQHLYGRALDVRFPARLADVVDVARAMRRCGEAGSAGTRIPGLSISTPGRCAIGTSTRKDCRIC